MVKNMSKKNWEKQKLFMFIELLLLPFIGLGLMYYFQWTDLRAEWIFNVASDITGMILGFLLFISVVKNREDVTLVTGIFAYMVALNTTMMLLDMLSWCADGMKQYAALTLAANEIYYLCGVAVIVLFWDFIVEYSEAEDPRFAKLSKLVHFAAIIASLLILGNIFGKYYYYVDENGEFCRAWLYTLNMVFILAMASMIALLIRQVKIPGNRKRVLLYFVSFPMIGAIIQAFYKELSVMHLATQFALVLIFGNIFKERSQDLLKKELDIQKKEAQILLAERKQQRVAAELNLAADIQRHMMPASFPSSGHFALHATMSPAKEVGGDFYDFFPVDEEHLVLVMADVSGKGVPAALYMMTTETMIKNAAKQGLPPGQVLELVNAQLCENVDQVEMFVTVWIGILEPSTGRLLAANAGHEYPIIRHRDGQFEIFKDKHGLVLGGMEGIRYREYELTLEPGSALFMYTDGVTEATSEELELFGMERLVKALNKNPQAMPEELLQNVRRDVDDFVGAAPQFDDLTMMAICMK